MVKDFSRSRRAQFFFIIVYRKAKAMEKIKCQPPTSIPLTFLREKLGGPVKYLEKLIEDVKIIKSFRKIFK